MEQKYSPSSDFEGISKELKKLDPETWKQWDNKRSKELRINGPASIEILKVELEDAIDKRGWKYKKRKECRKQLDRYR